MVFIPSRAKIIRIFHFQSCKDFKGQPSYENKCTLTVERRQDWFFTKRKLAFDRIILILLIFSITIAIV